MEVKDMESRADGRAIPYQLIFRGFKGNLNNKRNTTRGSKFSWKNFRSSEFKKRNAAMKMMKQKTLNCKLWR
jgi:hypothetical protein